MGTFSHADDGAVTIPPHTYFDSQGFYVVVVPDDAATVARQIDIDLRRERHLAGVHNEQGQAHLHYRLRMEEDEMGSGEIPTGRTKTTWTPRLGKQFRGDSA